MIFPAAGLLLPESEGGRRHGGHRRGRRGVEGAAGEAAPAACVCSMKRSVFPWKRSADSGPPPASCSCLFLEEMLGIERKVPGPPGPGQTVTSQPGSRDPAPPHHRTPAPNHNSASQRETEADGLKTTFLHFGSYLPRITRHSPCPSRGHSGQSPASGRPEVQ